MRAFSVLAAWLLLCVASPSVGFAQEEQEEQEEEAAEEDKRDKDSTRSHTDADGNTWTWGLDLSLLRIGVARRSDEPARSRNFEPDVAIVPGQFGFRVLYDPAVRPFSIPGRGSDPLRLMSVAVMLLMEAQSPARQSRLSLGVGLAFFNHFITLGIAFDLYRGVPAAPVAGTDARHDTVSTGLLGWALSPEGEITAENISLVLAISVDGFRADVRWRRAVTAWPARSGEMSGAARRGRFPLRVLAVVVILAVVACGGPGVPEEPETQGTGTGGAEREGAPVDGPGGETAGTGSDSTPGAEGSGDDNTSGAKGDGDGNVNGARGAGGDIRDAGPESRRLIHPNGPIVLSALLTSGRSTNGASRSGGGGMLSAEATDTLGFELSVGALQVSGFPQGARRGRFVNARMTLGTPNRSFMFLLGFGNAVLDGDGDRYLTSQVGIGTNIRLPQMVASGRAYVEPWFSLAGGPTETIFGVELAVGVPLGTPHEDHRRSEELDAAELLERRVHVELSDIAVGGSRAGELRGRSFAR